MKALTLTQPWATLVAIGAKRIETRGWSTSYRGPLAIHTAKGLADLGGEVALMTLCRSEPFRSALIGAGYLGTPGLPRGAIVAVCELVDCRPTDEEAARHKQGWFKQVDGKLVYFELTDQERAFGDYSPGRFAWLLADVRALPEPIPAKGALGLWEYPGL
jgi:activating signal cointegrator 1